MRRRLAGLAITAAVALGFPGLTPAAHAATASTPLPSPSQDPFYKYKGSLTGIADGTVLKQRRVDLVLLADITTPIQAEQLLFRTTNEVGEPTIAVTTVILPLLGHLVPRILSWQTFYDTLGSQCDPSYDLRGGATPLGQQYFSSCDVEGQAEITAAATFLAQGDTVVTTDYEETNQAWAAGPLEGYATLDGIRAAETYLGDTESTTPVALVGYSGGAIASQWAAELAPAYAPSLDVVATAAGGVLVDPAHNLFYINGGATGWSDVIPAVFISIFGRAFGLDTRMYASKYGDKLAAEDAHAYINNLAGGNMTYQELLKPKYANIEGVPAVAGDLNQLIMGADGTPRSSMFLANGDGVTSNGWSGDGVMIAGDVEALAHEYCQRGLSVEFQQYASLTHTEAFVPFIAYAVPYLTTRLLGLPAASNCASIGPGNSLAPLPVG
jgi:pimeloyl-ACP methyl ester carboxylesterase